MTLTQEQIRRVKQAKAETVAILKVLESKLYPDTDLISTYKKGLAKLEGMLAA